MASHEHMRLRKGVWYLNLPIPADLQKFFATRDPQGNPTGNRKTHIVESLKTPYVHKAKELKAARAACWVAEFKRLRRDGNETTAPPHPAQAEADELRAAFRAAKDDDERDSVLERAIELAYRHHPEAQHGEHDEPDEEHVAKAEAIVDHVKGRKRTLRDALDAQRLDAERRPSTEEKYKHALGLLLKFVGNRDARPEHVTRDTALRFVDWLNHEAKTIHGGPYAPQTKQNMLTGLASLWDYLMHRRQIPEGPNIWHGHKITGKEKSYHAPKDDDEDVRHYTDAEIVKLLNAPDVREGRRTRYTKRTLLEVFVLAFYTGARLDEIVSRKVKEIEKQGRGYLLRIRSGKTDASQRDIPIVHPIPVAILARRLKGRKDQNAQVFDEFIAGGYDAKPAKSASKAILGYRQKVGLIGATNFHSTRKNFYTRLMELDVNNDWYSMYIGHSLGGMAKVYGKRTPTILTNVAKAIKYPSKVEAAFRKALGL